MCSKGLPTDPVIKHRLQSLILLEDQNLLSSSGKETEHAELVKKGRRTLWSIGCNMGAMLQGLARTACPELLRPHLTSPALAS